MRSSSEGLNLSFPDAAPAGPHQPICGMLPLAPGIESGSQILQSLAIAVVGGMMVSISLPLVITPALIAVLRSARTVLISCAA